MNPCFPILSSKNYSWCRNDILYWGWPCCSRECYCKYCIIVFFI